MCLYKRTIVNKHYLPTRKNGYNPPRCEDERLLYVQVPCGNCIECRKSLANNWRIRLTEELKTPNEKPHFVTMTFSEENLNLLSRKAKSDRDIFTNAVRLFLERWRKKNKKSPKHWLINERGHNGTERLHVHGIIWADNLTQEELQNIWQYGWVFIGDYCNLKTINYVVKYVLKVDHEHKEYKPYILCSSGIGSNYINYHRKTDMYELPNGNKVALPYYYYRKKFEIEEREKARIEKWNKGVEYILGAEFKTKDERAKDNYYRALNDAREHNITLGYNTYSTKQTRTRKQRLRTSKVPKKYIKCKVDISKVTKNVVNIT